MVDLRDESRTCLLLMAHTRPLLPPAEESVDATHSEGSVFVLLLISLLFLDTHLIGEESLSRICDGSGHAVGRTIA